MTQSGKTYKTFRWGFKKAQSSRKSRYLCKLHIIERPNAHDQIAFCAFHSFFNSGSSNERWLHTMHSNSNLEIRIAGSFGHQQLYEHIILQITCTSKSGAFRLPDFSADSDSAGLSMEFSFGDSGTRVTLSLRKRESFASD